NRTTEKMDSFIESFAKDYEEGGLIGKKELAEFVNSLEKPRKVILMVNAGKPVDAVLEQLTPLLETGDVVIDCGNSNFHETVRREVELKTKGLNFVGCGVSGGEVGALEGPSMMPGGSEEAWDAIKPFFEPAAALDFNGGPCVTHVGPDAAGHYVKMVHNGIEYAMMQIMAEGYDLLRWIYKLPASEIAAIFGRFQAGRLKSYLFEISVEVLEKEDDLESGYLIDYILDKAGQKGTGRWTVVDAFERGVAIPSISQAVMARIISSRKELRNRLDKPYPTPDAHIEIPIEAFEPMLEKAFYGSILAAYAQGYDLIQTASKEEGWDINLAEVSRIWEGGCIIRAELLNTLHKAYSKHQDDVHLFEIPDLVDSLKMSMFDFRNVVSYAMKNAIPVPVLSTSVAYIDNLTNPRSSANFIQGLRDYFGAHTYERTDREGTFHTQWND
ncbi:MAG: NADP-dependent phosphogluconate dehydrogenase, partial [Candidatus Peregrinibacteria bacterium]|nr:NADP-dependent phosphogluconate dehydrogenase [Candidatus Peregrinibacteria bacterium]